jgi:hypothetical protein
MRIAWDFGCRTACRTSRTTSCSIRTECELPTLRDEKTGHTQSDFRQRIPLCGPTEMDAAVVFRRQRKARVERCIAGHVARMQRWSNPGKRSQGRRPNEGWPPAIVPDGCGEDCGRARRDLGIPRRLRGRGRGQALTQNEAGDGIAGHVARIESNQIQCLNLRLANHAGDFAGWSLSQRLGRSIS